MRLFYRARFAIAVLIAASLWAGADIAPAQAAEPTAVGLWEQVDENTNKAESWFRIAEKNGVYEGVLVKAFPKPGGEDPAKWLCTKCEGVEKNAPVVGLALIKNMQRTGSLNYENGTIMDPRDGAVYRALMEVSPDGKKLTVRGFLGISLFGRSQVWNWLPDNAIDAAPVARRNPAPPAKQAPAKKSAPLN